MLSVNKYVKSYVFYLVNEISEVWNKHVTAIVTLSTLWNKNIMLNGVYNLAFCSIILLIPPFSYLFLTTNINDCIEGNQPTFLYLPVPPQFNPT